MIVLKQVIIMALLILTGVICYKTNVISKEASKSLSSLVLMVVNPIVIIVSYQVEFDEKLLKGLLLALLFSVISIGAAIVLSHILLRKKEERLSLERFSCIYSNCGFMGIPLVNGVYGDDALDTDYENEIPEMLIDSIAFDIRANCNVLDGCYADTAAIGYNIAGDTRLIGCDFFNNKLMGMKNSLAINHESGKLQVHMTTFRATAGREVLYSGNKDDVDWSMNNVSGFSENIFDK